MALSRSNSDPTLTSGSSSVLKASAGAMGLATSGSQGALTTNLYDKMSKEGKFRNYVAPGVRPAGKSITVPLADSVERDLQSEIYFPVPPTPIKERKFRMSSLLPGEIHVHHGLKTQKLPGEEFRYGMRGFRGSSTEDAMKAGQLFGVAEYKNSVQERVYDSVKREPIGKPHIRGHKIKMLPEGFGNASAEHQDGGMVIFPTDMPQDSEEVRLMYRHTHSNYAPGEQNHRKYTWPEETKDKDFKFGAHAANAVEGAGAKLALNVDVEDDGTYKRTKFVTKVNEDYRNVQHPKLMRKVHCKQGATGPPLPEEHRFGIKSTISDYTAGSCIKGYYSLEEQLPDEDLGRSMKPGRRNVTTETRAFGVPSIRTDIGAPHPSKRSVADLSSYGDEPSAASILNPQRFDCKGISDREFLVRRPRQELEALVKTAPLEGVDFDSLFDEAQKLFDDGLPLVSLDSMLYLQSKRIEKSVGDKMHGL